MVILINFNLWDSAIVDVNVAMGDMNGKESENSYKFEEYHLRGDLMSTVVEVNGQNLTFSNGKFPELTPIEGNGVVKMLPASIVWVKVENA